MVTDPTKASVMGDGIGFIRCNQVATFSVLGPGASIRDIGVRITGQSVPVNHSVCQSHGQSVNHPVSQSVSESFAQSVSHSPSQSANQTVNHAVSQSITQSVTQNCLPATQPVTQNCLPASSVLSVSVTAL